MTPLQEQKCCGIVPTAARFVENCYICDKCGKSWKYQLIPRN